MSLTPVPRANLLPPQGTLEMEHLVARVRTWYAFSKEEAAVALGIWAGCDDMQIAAWLDWEPSRVEVEIRRCCLVLRPLGLGSRTGVGEAVVRAMQSGGR